MEYAWGLTKQFYQSKSLQEKKTKDKFKEVVRASEEFVKKGHVERFSAKCRCYMMAYNAYDNNSDPLTYKVIKHFAKMMKCHRNIADQDKVLVQKAWKEAISNLSED